MDKILDFLTFSSNAPKSFYYCEHNYNFQQAEEMYDAQHDIDYFGDNDYTLWIYSID